MVRFSEIQQLPDFLELFPGNFRTICPRFEDFGIFGRMESALSQEISIPFVHVLKLSEFLGDWKAPWVS